MEIDAVVISMNEPQLDRCLRSLREQTYPFRTIMNINGVVPHCKAWNRSVEVVSAEWFAMIDGDTYYNPDALETAIKFMEKKPPTDTCGGYILPLRDAFLDIPCGSLCVMRSKAFKSETAVDDIKSPNRMMWRLRRKGWYFRKDFSTYVGTHFENPDEYQVFHRFFVLATKDGRKGYEVNKLMVEELYKEHGNPLYKLAMDALDFGWSKGSHGRGINDVYNQEMYKEWKSMRS